MKEKKSKPILAYNNPQFSTSPLGRSVSTSSMHNHLCREDIHPEEEIGRRGFKRYPDFR